MGAKWIYTCEGVEIQFAAKRILLCNPNTQIYNHRYKVCAKVQTKKFVFHAKEKQHMCVWISTKQIDIRRASKQPQKSFYELQKDGVNI